MPAGAKLLFGEISSLCNKQGYCWAGNAYFAELYQTSERTIINWINSLSNAGHISVSFTYVPGKKEIQSRLIRITGAVLSKIYPQNEENTESAEATPEKQPDDGDSEVVKNSSPRGEKNFTTYGKNFQEVVKNSSKGGEKNFMDNTTCNNTSTTTTASDPPEDDTLPTVEKVVAAQYSPGKIKNQLSALDDRLFFDDDFYPRAAAFMLEKNLDLDYLSWLKDQCEKRNYRSFKGLFFTLFFKENMAEEYKASLLPAFKQLPPPFTCLACGSVYDRNDEECPDCGLPQECSFSDKILLYRELRVLPPEKRREYLSREDDIRSECGVSNHSRCEVLISDLQREYGLTVSQ